MARTQKNKATEYHLGLLKAKLARYRAQLLEPASKSGPQGVGFDVQKSGDARVALIGFPSVGKSTLLGKVTHTASETAAYEFTTLTAIPGVIEYKGARIQLLDLPGIVEGASQGYTHSLTRSVSFNSYYRSWTRKTGCFHCENCRLDHGHVGRVEIGRTTSPPRN
jgi:ribosome-interacting GTPase 1